MSQVFHVKTVDLEMKYLYGMIRMNLLMTHLNMALKPWMRGLSHWLT